ncbi:hypothetical protein [Modicisalibacter xianhensis]|uniref:TrfB transcriptional repressor protein domain-containing protein n=1 Tax=Modicisalibacter xianhensis TaxID=442341 RepID=A0A1I3FQI9_9GAMM|nr:hypothetical protein [Halomonas xianhensis]SFI13434.1 hypothetical protein SAMN04487959_12037 [Halomonas xianhensis]
MPADDINPKQIYAALARLRMNGRACDGAIDVLTKVCDTYAAAAQKHGVTRAAVSQAAKRILAEVEREFVEVEVRLPKDKLLALEEWLVGQGGAMLTSSVTGR